MKEKTIVAIIITTLLMPLLSVTAYANSSWHWLTKTRPFDILPYVAVLTILVEYFGIKKLNSINRAFKLFVIVCLANMTSFLLPYVIFLLPSAVGYTFEMSLIHLPTYIVGFGYLFLTLIVEVPVVYIGFRNVVANKKKIFISIITVNVATTIMVAVVERVFCRGTW